MEVVWTGPSLRDLRRLDRHVADRIRAAVRRYAGTGHGDVAKLQGTDEEFRLRVGDYRVIFEFEGNRVVIIILRVRHRREVYRG